MYKNKTLPQVPIPTAHPQWGTQLHLSDPPSLFQQKGSHECPWGLGLTSGALMAPHPGRRRGTGPGGLGSVLCHLSVIAQKEGSEGGGSRAELCDCSGTPVNLFLWPSQPRECQ